MPPARPSSLQRFRRIAFLAVLPLLVAAGFGVGYRWYATSDATAPGAAAPHQHAPTESVLVAAAVAAPGAVNRAQWTAAGADSSASLAFDGDSSTFWTSAAAGAGRPRLTIDMGSRRAVSALKLLPRRGATGDGNVGKFRIDTSVDGKTWAKATNGTFADDDTLKEAPFVARTARYVRLTALSEGDGGNGAVSVAEVNVIAAADPALPRTGWTATASSYQDDGLVPAYVLDGDTTTFWHSRFSDPVDELPNEITIDMKAKYAVSGLSYLPQQATWGNNGNIGEYTVEVSTNGTDWVEAATGSWEDTKAAKTVEFESRDARYVRVTALTEAGGRGPWTTAAEFNVLGHPNVAKLGRWSAPISFPLVPVAAALLPNGKVLTWAGDLADASLPAGNGQTVTALFDPATGSVTQRTVTNTQHNMFCPGISTLPDGRILVNGGDDPGKSSIYDWTDDSWSSGGDLTLARGYNSSTTLPDGRVFTIGGSWDGALGGKYGEVWSGAWSPMPGADVTPILTNDQEGIYRSDNHAWLFAWSGGRVLQAGPSKNMNWYDTNGTGSVTPAGTRADDTDSMNGNAVMYTAGKILTVGGGPNYTNSTTTANAHVLTIRGNSVSARKVASMQFPRSFHNSVVLPDGKVLVAGGQSYAVNFNDDNVIYNPELWDPLTEKFTTMAPHTVPRTYHSIALLLPDARVFVGGGGLCGACLINHLNGEIFSPPYLLKANGKARPRPAIIRAPAAAANGASITVAADGDITGFSLVRQSTVTHTVNTDQRRIALTPTAVGDDYRVTIPSDPGVALPGYYMLFAIDSKGVPSVARMIRIG